MNGLGLKYWANDPGRNLMPGLLVGFGVLLLAATRFSPEQNFNAILVIGIGFIVSGIVSSIIRHLVRQRRARDNK